MEGCPHKTTVLFRDFFISWQIFVDKNSDRQSRLSFL